MIAVQSPSDSPHHAPSLKSPESNAAQWSAPLSPHPEIVRQLIAEQGRCSLDVAALHARLAALEQQVLNMTDRQASASSRMPMLVAEVPRMTRLVAQSPGEPSVGVAEAQQRIGLSGEAAAVTNTHETAALRKQLEDIEELHTDDIAGLRDAMEATREGIERLARDLHFERNERQEGQRELHRLSTLGPTIDRYQTKLRSELKELIREGVANATAEVNSRVQLSMIELREEVQRTPRELVQAEDQASNSSVNVARSLHEWLPQEADGNIAATKSMLMYLGVFDGLLDGVGSPDQMVARPNIRFVHRAVIAMKHATGYPPGILEDWPEPKEAKMDFLKSVWGCVAQTLKLKDLDFDAEGVLKCTNRNGTRRLLQLLAIAASKERGQQRRPGLPQLPPC